MATQEVTFPRPFGGITQKVAVNPRIIEKMVQHIISGCGEGHAHNFAIEIDAPSGWPVIYGSELLMACTDKVRW